MAEKEKRTTGLAAAIAKVNAKHNKEENRSGSLEVALAILADHGLGPGRWCLGAKAQEERPLEWFGYGVPLFVRVLAFLKLSTLGYLPSSGGVRKVAKAFHLDDRKHGHCKRLNALLAVIEVAGKKIIPVSPSHIRNAINDASVRAFTEQEGREPDKDDLKFLLQDAHDVRRALEFLEDIGMCIRTDDQDTTFDELRQTEEGRARLKTLSGDNKIRVYVHLIPRPTKVFRGGQVCPPSKSIPKDLQPLYKQILALKLDIDPTAFAFDGELQATIRAELDERQKLLSARDEELRQAILAKYPSANQNSAAPNPNGVGEARVATQEVQNPSTSGAADRHSTALNPTGEQGLSKPERSSALIHPADRRAVDSNRGAEAPLVSEPRRKTAAPASPSDSFVDKAFADQVVAAFVNGGKPSPNSKQLARLQHDLPDDMEARLSFVTDLRQKMRSIEHPGVLPKLTEEFNLAWPMRLAKKEADFARSQPQQMDPVESLAIDMRFVEELPGHPDATESRAAIARAKLESPKLYAAALEFLANSKRMVS